MHKHFLVFVILLIAIPALVYVPGLGGMFLFDDHPNIVVNQQLHVADRSLGEWVRTSQSGHSGPLGRPISMLSFALNIEFCGLNPTCFKITNLAIHIVSGLLLFLFVVCLFRRYLNREQQPEIKTTVIAMAGLVALLWVLHPINLTSVLYVVQRMNSLSGLFVLAGAWLYIVGRQKLADGQGGYVAILAAFAMTIPAVLSKENGALLPVFLLLIEGYFYGFRTPSRTGDRIIRGLFVLTVLLPVLGIVLFLLMNPEWLLNRYERREFSFSERLLTQPRVLWFYVSLILLPTNQRLSLFHDYFQVSEGLLSPYTTLLSLAGIMALVVGIYLCRHKARLLSFGLAWFLCGHLIESGIIPLEMVFEHRNYIPSIGLLIPLVYYLHQFAISPKTSRLRRTGLYGLVVLFALVTTLRASAWSNMMLFAGLEARNNPDSVRVNNMLGQMYSRAYASGQFEEYEEAIYAEAESYLLRAYELDPNSLTALTTLTILNSRTGKPIDPDWFELLVEKYMNIRMTPSNVSSVARLFRCVQSKACSYEEISVDRLLDALKQNPTFRGWHAGIVYTSASLYYWYHEQDVERAIEYSRMAYEAAPNEIVHQLNYARILAAAGMHKEAREMIGIIQTNDPLNLYRAQIQDIYEQM